MSLKNSEKGRKETVDTEIMRKYVDFIGITVAGILVLVILYEDLALYSMFLLAAMLLIGLPFCTYLVLNKWG